MVETAMDQKFKWNSIINNIVFAANGGVGTVLAQIPLIDSAVINQFNLYSRKRDDASPLICKKIY